MKADTNTTDANTDADHVVDAWIDSTEHTGLTEADIDEQRAGTHRESTTLAVIAPTIRRSEVASAGERVGAIAYPYRVADAQVRIERPLLAAREAEYVVSVDRCRRLAIRADVVPSAEHRTVEDVLVLPSVLTDDAADEMARDAAFRWTLRRFALWSTPTVDLQQTVNAYKLFWLVKPSDGTVLVDSIRGDRQLLSV